MKIIKKNASDKTRKNIEICICAVIFAVYSAFMIYLLFFKNRAAASARPVIFGEDIKLIPLRTISEFTEILMTSRDTRAIQFSIINLAGNVIMFIPYGLFLPILFKKCRQYGCTLLVAGSGIITIELTQLLTRRGVCDIDDLLLNLIGVSLGFVLFNMCRRIVCRPHISDNSDE